VKCISHSLAIFNNEFILHWLHANSYYFNWLMYHGVIKNIILAEFFGTWCMHILATRNGSSQNALCFQQFLLFLFSARDLCGPSVDRRDKLETLGQPTVNKKIGELWSTDKKVTMLMFTHTKSSMRVLCMLMNLSSGHVTLLWGEIQLRKLFPKSEFTVLGGLKLGSAPNF